MVIMQSTVKILGYLLSNPYSEKSIRDIALKTGINYRIAYETINRLIANGIIKMQKNGSSNFCRPILDNNHSLFAYVESIKKLTPTIKVIKNELSKIRSVFYTALIFGSHAKNNATKKSDVDLLLIVPDSVDKDKLESELSSVLNTLNYEFDINIISEKEFIALGHSKELNIRNEVTKNKIILFGAENYYRLLTK